MKRQSFLHCLLVLMLLAGAVSVPRTAAPAPQFAPATDTERFRFLDQDGITPVDSAPHAGTSYYTTVRNTDECEAVHSQRGAAYIAGCPPVTEPGYSFGSNPYLSDDKKFPVAYWRAGEKIYFRIKFTEPVKVNPDNLPTVQLDFDWVRRENENDPDAPPITATLVPGEGTASDPTRDMLTFVYTVKERDDCLGDGVNVPVDGNYGFQHNTAGAIQDLNGNNFDFSATSARLREVFDIYYGGLGSTLQEAAFRGIRFGIDTYPSSVRITGLIIRDPVPDATHDERGARKVAVNFEDITPNRLNKKGVSPHPDDPSSRVEELTVQTAAFDIEIRFFNYGTGDGDGVASDEPQGFEAQDIKIADASSGMVLSDWAVSHPKFIGQDHRDPGDWEDSSADSSLGYAKNSAAFLVYEARITPPNGFDGTVNIFLEEGATLDIAGNLSLKSNVFTVPVRTPPTVQVARPAEETGVVTEDFAVDFQFSRNVVSPFDAEKIRITQADGTALAWDVAVTQPTSPSATVSAVVTPAFHFDGKVHITLDAGAVNEAAAVDDTVAVPEYLSNAAATEALVVDVDTVPPRVTETPKIVDPEEEVYTVGNELTVEISFDEEGVTYEGDNPPYVVIYLGERTVANARHATWKKGSERGGSTIVPFAYPIQAGDFATSVSLDTSGVLIPQGTRVVDGDGNELSGQATPAIAPGETVAQLPQTTTREAPIPFPTTQQQEPPTFDLTDSPVSAVIYLPETSDPKSSASAVPRSPVVFNELGNGSGDAEDWLELRNVTGSDVSLKDWELSVVADGKKEDTSLIIFPDVSVPANGLLLITNSASDKTPLAGSENRGLSHAFLVNAGLSLPDDGKFLLILRNAKEKLGMNEAFIDVAGGGGSDTDAFIREQEGLYDTHVWPLQVLQSPGGDTEDALSSGKVWQRAKADIVGYHKDAWAEAAFTGIGYDRKVSESAATAGTPGYPNGAVKTAAATPRGAVTFSEIMLDSSGGTLPQWIELYNHSKTEALNLNRWQLELQNEKSADLIGRPIVTLTLQEKVIQPNQTLLIVAGAARASSADVFPEDRVYNLLKLHEKNLRIKTARDTFLSTEGFYLKLTDRNGNLVDEVGNTDGHRRTDDAPSWAVPLSGLEDSRSSLVRRYKDGVAESGTRRAGWASAARFKQFKVESLHYGHADDIGTPGYRQGGALPVELSSFTVTRTDAGAVVVTWTTESEVDNAGFNLRRSLKRDSGFTLLNPVLIAGAGTTGERQVYTFTDTSAKPGVEYYYQIEEVSLGGQRAALALRMLRGPVSASNRMLTTFGEVKRRE